MKNPNSEKSISKSAKQTWIKLCSALAGLAGVCAVAAMALVKAKPKYNKSGRPIVLLAQIDHEAVVPTKQCKHVYKLESISMRQSSFFSLETLQVYGYTRPELEKNYFCENCGRIYVQRVPWPRHQGPEDVILFLKKYDEPPEEDVQPNHPKKPYGFWADKYRL